MKKDNKGMSIAIKGVKISVVAILSTALALAFAGAIMMFFDEITHCYSSGYWSSRYYYSHEANPVAGIMPFFGFALALAAFIMVFPSAKKPKLLIGTIVLLSSSLALTGASVAIIGGSDIALFGYYVCCSAMGLYFIALAPVVALLVLLQLRQKKTNDDESTQSTNGTTAKQSKPASTGELDQLQKAKELFDAGILSEEEYMDMKKQILSKLA